MFDELEIQEAAAIQGELSGSRYKVRLIEGDRLGSSGYYPAETLKKDGPRLFVKGTPMYFDHQTAEEKASRPHGRVMDLVGELAEDAYYDNDGLYADVEIYEHQRPIVKSLQKKIGISIRARAVTELSSLNGKRVPIVKELLEARSADFVVRPGAGGKIVSILESADSQIEEENESMDEVLEALKGLGTKFDALDSRISTIEEAAKATVEEETIEESEKVVDYAKVLEIAEELSKSKLDADGRARVIDLHRANGKPLAELIDAEESYIKSHVEETINGNVEDVEESEKSAREIKLPSVWKKK